MTKGSRVLILKKQWWYSAHLGISIRHSQWKWKLWEIPVHITVTMKRNENGNWTIGNVNNDIGNGLSPWVSLFLALTSRHELTCITHQSPVTSSPLTDVPCLPHSQQISVYHWCRTLEPKGQRATKMPLLVQKFESFCINSVSIFYLFIINKSLSWELLSSTHKIQEISFWCTCGDCKIYYMMKNEDYFYSNKFSNPLE